MKQQSRSKQNTERSDIRTQHALYEKFIPGLAPQPGLLLIFAICVVLGGPVAGYGIAAGTPVGWIIGLAAFACALGSAIGAIWIISQTPSATKPDSSEKTEFDGVLVEVQTNLTRANQISSHLFQHVIRDELARFQRKTVGWASGRIEITDKYSNTLLFLYTSARNSVFSTSVPEYLKTWSDPFGGQILRAHSASGAPVQRVFVFENRATVDNEAVKIMWDQRGANVDVLVFYKDENPQLLQRVRDFTMIDGGEAIGVTVAFTQGHLGAQWFFMDESTMSEYSITKTAVLRNSKRLEEEFPLGADKAPKDRQSFSRTPRSRQRDIRSNET